MADLSNYEDNEIPLLTGNVSNKDYIEPQSNLFEQIMGKINDKMASPYSTLYNFYENYKLGSNPNNNLSDKQRHALANCKSAQYYDMLPILGIDYGRELWDMTRKNTWDKVKDSTFKQVSDDSRRDIEADNYGIMQGLLNPFGNCERLLDSNYLDNLNK